MAEEIILETVCGSLTEKACSIAIASQFKSVFIMIGAILLFLIILQVIIFSVKTGKKSKSTSAFWVGMILMPVIEIIFLIVAYFMLPWLIRVFNIIKL